MKAVVLAYHSHNVFGTRYGENDHVSLREDLETITRAGGPKEAICARDTMRKSHSIEGDGSDR